MNMVLYALVKTYVLTESFGNVFDNANRRDISYYVLKNKSRDKKWNSMSEEERLEYLQNTKDEGNKRLDFRFEH